jgi:phosphoribosylaminoimidazolecarboxamide formyltransferase/IMP cyclohydrolase
MTLRVISRALLSVSDKTSLLELAEGLSKWKVELISTGGTRAVLAEAGYPVKDVSEVTGFPEMLGGRVKTLHPRIHAGILAVRENREHVETLLEHNIQWIDLVVCNLYPFEATAAQESSTPEDIIENIDIGGPTLVRAAAKNHRDLTVLTEPAQYHLLLKELEENEGSVSLAFRQRLAAAAFTHIAEYDIAISDYFNFVLEQQSFPPAWMHAWKRRQELRYGENPHQQAAFYVDPLIRHGCVANARVLHGKELSYNNILDLDNALSLVREFSSTPACAVIKHNNPCGAALGQSLSEAFHHAYEADPQSAFGGILGFNQVLDEETAQAITEPNRFIECIIAPGYQDAAFEVLTTRPTWKKSVRILATGPLLHPDEQPFTLRHVDGGLLVQESDIRTGEADFAEATVVTERQPTEQELADLRFAWVVCKHVRSNAIVLAHNGAVVGVGAGQMSRVDSVHLSVRKAGKRSKGAVLASDAFFPFRDNIDEAAAAGVTAVVQPGGSRNDPDSIAACNEHGLAMIFTGARHFKH